MDGDGELRLTIMATLAQEESRKVSERVKAGQQISRINGTIYGCGNILGYDRVGDTYVKNPDRSETVRMIYDMYLDGKGTMVIANELTRLQRLNASGLDNAFAKIQDKRKIAFYLQLIEKADQFPLVMTMLGK